MPVSFRDWVRSVRRKKNLTQEDFATAVGVSQTTVSQWESGRNGPSLANLKAIAKLDDKKLAEVAHYVDETSGGEGGEGDTDQGLAIDQPGGMERYLSLIEQLEFISDEGIALLHDQIRFVLRERYPRVSQEATQKSEEGNDEAKKSDPGGES